MYHKLKKIVKLSRLPFTLYPITSLLIGAAVVNQENNMFILLLIPAGIMLSSAAMLWNDIEDRIIDSHNGRRVLYKSSDKFIKFIKLSIIIMISTSLLLTWIVNIYAFCIALLIIFTLWAYNSKPIQASRRPISSLILLSGAGAFMPYILGVTLGNLSIKILVAGLFWWLGRISISILKDYKDVFGDARYNKKTFLLKYGYKSVGIVSIFCLLVGYTGFIFMNLNDNNLWAITLFTVALSVFTYFRIDLLNHKSTYKEFNDTFGKIVKYQLFLDSSILLWLV